MPYTQKQRTFCNGTTADRITVVIAVFILSVGAMLYVDDRKNEMAIDEVNAAIASYIADDGAADRANAYVEEPRLVPPRL
jgi:hypothetical protein